MKRAAIYSRYSTDLRRDRSIEDQVALCREFAARNGWRVVAEFNDRAQSGASMIGRDGVLAMVEAAKRHEGLSQHVANPWLIDEYVDAYNAERQGLAKVDPGEIGRLRAQQDALAAELERVKRASIKGMIEEAEAEMPRIRCVMQASIDRLQMIDEEPDVIALHPASIDRHRRSVDDLIATLDEHARIRTGSRASGSRAVAD